MAFGSRARAGRPRTREPLEAAALYDYAVQSLGRKMRTVAELKRLMRRRVEPGEAGEAKMEAVVAMLRERKYLDDTRYAADYTRLRQENQRFGRRRVQQELLQRGVHEETVSRTLDAAYEDLPEAEQARRYIERKRLRKPADEKETARIVRNLVRAGFSISTIFSVLKTWNVPDDALPAVDDAEPDDVEADAAEE